MAHKLLSGRDIAQQILEKDLKPRVELLNKKCVQPKLVVILIGNHQASESYVKQKEKFAAQCGILSEIRRFEPSITEEELLKELRDINEDDSIHGVIVQLPIPDHISVEKVLHIIDPVKDVDGWTPTNVGKLFLGEECLQSCTPKGIIMMLDAAGVKIEGKNAVVIGRSNIVGKPISGLLLNRGATVTTCHRHTTNLDEHIKNADILVVAVGKAEFIKGEQLKPGCVVIDVGINRKEDGKMCGDVHFESASEVASQITPVPGGVGPMTVVSLIENTITSAEGAKSF
jgi:methylenetetrahydrofolate dehydrogenase (NADP+) / methenyltetrahydrofolate cyclohydrolase